MLEELLLRKKSVILKKWFDLILQSYPTDTQRFLKSQKDRFTNPVGITVSEGLEALFDEILRGAAPERLSPFLDRIIRIRAVQDLSPSQAVVFVFALKKLIREELADDIRKRAVLEAVQELEARIDELALLAFDTYMGCRERLYEIRANELKNRTHRLLKKTNYFYELQERESKEERGKATT